MALKILTFTSLFPNNRQPSHGIFVENRLRHLVESGSVDLTVIAPVPWFPFRSPVFGQYAKYADVAPVETRHGVKVLHPKYPVLPKVGMNIAPWLMEKAVSPTVNQLMASEGPFDVIDAHYFYPDGVAATRIGQRLGLPVVITGRGTDLSLIPTFRGPRQKIAWAISHCTAMVTVCAALKHSLIELGAPDDKVTVLRNGVDLDTFHPKDRKAARLALGLEGFILASVGHLIERKGHHIVIEALQQIPDAHLVIAGDGPERTSLEQLAQACNVTDRVSFLGALPHDRLVDIYNAADALVLASSREGWANVLLEAMACGTPAVATDIWGTPEVVQNRSAGRLVPERTAQSVAATIKDLRADLPDRQQTRLYAEGFSWDETTQGLLHLFNSVCQKRQDV